MENLQHIYEPVLPPRDVFASARKLITGWTWYGTYPEACAFVTGYLHGLSGGRMIAEFQVWLVGKYGGDPKVAFWSRALALALPDRESPRSDDLSGAERAIAIDKLFQLLIEWLDESQQG